MTEWSHPLEPSYSLQSRQLLPHHQSAQHQDLLEVLVYANITLWATINTLYCAAPVSYNVKDFTDICCYIWIAAHCLGLVWIMRKWLQRRSISTTTSWRLGRMLSDPLHMGRSIRHLYGNHTIAYSKSHTSTSRRGYFLRRLGRGSKWWLR